MKNIIKIFVLVLAVIFSGCSLEDPIKSIVTDYAQFEMTGPQHLYWQVGEAYVEPGITAAVGEEELEVETEGSVDSDTPGVYVLNYSAVNAEGFSSTVTRFVAVGYRDVAYYRDLSGTYSPTNTVTKIADGFYLNSDLLPTNGIKAIMADLGNGQLVVPPQATGFGTVYADPAIDSSSFGIINSETSFTIAQILGSYGLFTRTFIKQ